MPPANRRTLLRRCPRAAARCWLRSRCCASALRDARRGDRRGATAHTRPRRILVKYATRHAAARAGGREQRGAGAGDPTVTAPHTQAAAPRARRQRRRRAAPPAPPARRRLGRARLPRARRRRPRSRTTAARAARPGDWQQLQWNFAGPFGVNAPQAWANVAADGAPGGKGVIVAVLDTGVAYANRGRFRRSPDFSRFGFVGGYDFIAHNRYPDDRNGHGTFVAGTIAEATNNRYGLTGLAFGARIMPVRVLDTQGEGEASTIAEGVRFAVKHGAQVINLSLEFSSDVTASDIPELIEALRYARRRGVLVVAAAGNEAHTRDRLSGARARRRRRRRDDRTRLPGRLLQRRQRADARRARRRRRRRPPRRPQLQPRRPGRARHLPGDLHRRLAAALRHARRATKAPRWPRRTSPRPPRWSSPAACSDGTRRPAQIVARLRATARKLGGGGDEAPVRRRAASTRPPRPRRAAPAPSLR